METKNNIKNITLKDILNIFRQRIWVIILVAIVTAAGIYTVNTATYKPQYSSTATMYILRQPNEEISAGDVASDFSLALKVINDCSYFLKGHTVLDSVISELSLDMDYKQLYNNIAVYNPTNTRILEVTFFADSPELAKRIVDMICREGVETINNTMGFNQINLHEFGAVNPEPSNKTSVLIYLIFGILAAALTYLIFIIIYLVDDTIKTEEDIEKYLGLSILGDIPNADSVKKKGYGYGRKKQYRAKF